MPEGWQLPRMLACPRLLAPPVRGRACPCVAGNEIAGAEPWL